MFSNGPSIVTTGLDLLVDAADQQSYPGSGTVWRDLRSGTTGSLTGSVSYTSEFYGGLTFTNSSSAVIFPGTTANYGSGSFTVEMAFKPTFINGIHYLMSKNSGSFPNWAIYLSGSAGAGKLWSEFNINASVSCSYSSSTVFETGSVYQVDVRIFPALSASGIYVNGQSEGGVLGNGGGTLTSTASLFVGNYSQGNTQNFSGSIYTIKSYLNASVEQPVINYNATATRLSRIPASDTGKKQFEVLVVGGGGGGARYGGGGAGGLLYFNNYPMQSGRYTITVGNRGNARTSGQNTTFGVDVAYGGGNGGQINGNGGSGGSGGGATTIAGLGISGQGNNGGTNLSGVTGGGGGGGAGTAGVSPTNSTTRANGGSGSYIASFAVIGGSPAGWFAGGGGAGSANPYNGLYGFGGIGGGGNGEYHFSQNGSTGSANTGGGGGGGYSVQGYEGGSGIVAVKYQGVPVAIGGEITQSEGYTYHVFRTVGTSSFTIF
jgi:hypothetical protein